uniref:Uncharacterized protein n=1 Tax=Psilocybe cubensis TaxID=181762 RepID=A0A8H7Y6L7_PSICU
MILGVDLVIVPDTVVPVNPNMATKTLPEEAYNWPFSVGIHHPGLENKADGSKTHIGYLGHRFKDIGINPWPGKGEKLPVIPKVVHVVGSETWFHD